MEINTFFKQNYTVTILHDLYLSTFAPDQRGYLKNIYISIFRDKTSGAFLVVALMKQRHLFKLASYSR